MVIRTLMLASALLLIAPTSAFAKSCSLFGRIMGYDADAHTVEVKFTKGNQRKFFPRPDSGGGNQQSKLPKKCKGKVKKQKVYPVKETGGRMSVTQVRANFQGSMQNDTEDPAWLPGKLAELIEGKTEVALVFRPGMDKDKTLNLTTIYLPITEEELKEIERIEAQAEDMD